MIALASLSKNHRNTKKCSWDSSKSFIYSSRVLSSFLNKTPTEMKNVLFVVVAIPKTFDGVKLWVRNQPFSL
jgi:hypothetical protein